ncbi:pentatricopeptide repeat-containing protein At4g02750 isoform X2 [Cryptomeria japonica]|nr:pentatricopeptide repeat-containing protein At4g02750 isoform X2 [Cryptomeria japonica]
MIETQFQCQDISLENKLVSIYAKWGDLEEARRVFDGMPKRNVVSWTVMIAAYARHGLCDEALTLLYRMQGGEGIQPNQFTFASVLPACQNIEVLKEIHGEVVRLGFDSNVFVGNGLVDMYGKCGQIEVARQMFDKMPLRDVVSWNAMLAGYVQNGLVEEAIKLFGVMPERDVFSWNTMIAGYLQAGDVEKAYALFEAIPQRNIVSWNTMIAGYAQNGFIDKAFRLFEIMPERNVKTWNSLITGYANNGLIEEALQLFQSMPDCNVISWNAMISGYAQNGHGEEALELFRQMQLAEVKPDSDTFVVVLPACCTFASLEEGKEVHGVLIKNGFEIDVLVGNTLVGMYAKCGSIEDAHKMFDKMLQRDAVSWSAIIVGCAMHGCAKEALELFENMQLSGINPNHVTFIGVLSACCHSGLVDHGWQCFNSMSQIYHITPTMEHYGCMIDLLGRAGRLDEAQILINKMAIKPDADMWGSLLSACKIHTNIELAEWAAKELFELDPQNPATFVILFNIYAEVGRWVDMERVQKMMKDKKVKKKPGCSWIVVDKKTHAFLVGG